MGCYGKDSTTGRTVSNTKLPHKEQHWNSQIQKITEKQKQKPKQNLQRREQYFLLFFPPYWIIKIINL